MSRIASALAAFRSGEGLKGQLLRGGVGSVAIKIGSTGLNVLLAIVLARALGAEGFGVYSFVFALITIMAIPAQMGLPNLVVRETAKAQAAGDWALMKGLWRWSTLMALMMSAALMAIGALAAWAFSSQLPQGGLTVFYWGLVLVPLVALGNLRGAALRGLRHVVQGQLPEFILRPAFLIALVLGAHFGLSSHAVTASDAMMLHAVASLVAFVVGAYLLVRARPKALRTHSTSETRFRLWFASALPLGLVEGIQMISQNVGTIGVGIAGHAEGVAYLRVAIQAALLVAVGINIMNAFVSPHLSHLYHARDFTRLQKLSTAAARVSSILAVAFFLLFFLLGPQLFSIVFGEEYRNAFPLFVVIAAGQLVNALTGCSSQLLAMAGFERPLFANALLALIINIALSAALIPYLGSMGAAIALSASLAIWNLSCAISALVRTRISTFAWPA